MKKPSMKFFALRCGLCDKAMYVGADDNKSLMVVCLNCEIRYSLEEINQRKDELAYGKPPALNTKELLKGSGISAVRRLGNRTKK